MPFPRKFKHLLEIELNDVETPDYVWITYAVRAVEKDGCCWAGWMIEAAFKKTPEGHPTASGDKLLPAMNNQVCPRCGKTLFRTEASLRMVPSTDQEPPHNAGDQPSIPMTYED
ncbi:MAG TPA: hypothetical protein PKH24_11325 [Sedimentisphaerales bacterium]|jgi:hypothetical protein|nr:hypothetical protein [Sedimentisphaerales bacterium]HNU28528.1 hypothetical protein [Sedimentisphaerales bacterium]